MNDKFTTETIKAIENSPLWKSLNQSAKALYEREGRFDIPKEEYQALRNMIMLKVILEDENVKEIVRKETYEQFKRQEG